jgi:hypothetical protein
MADSDSCHHLLRGRVGDDATRLDTFQQNTHLVTPRICSWSWCTSMVSGIPRSCTYLWRCANLLSLKMLWGTSSLALYIPWAGNAGPYLGISLWLWLGVLDAVQGVGLGMILLQVSQIGIPLFSSTYHLYADSFAATCLCYPRFLPDYWFCLRYGCAGNGAEQNRTWECFPWCSKVGFQWRLEG